MKLLISEESTRAIEDFAKSVGADLRCESLKIMICALHVSVIFSQPEHYSRLLNCEFRLSSEVGFLYEDVRAAFSACSASNAHPTPIVRTMNLSEIQRNDEYVGEVIEFCRANWSGIMMVPPVWYEMAMEISDKKIRKIFPAIADEALKSKISLLDIWRNNVKH